MEKIILVVGATGQLGKPVAKQLLLDGFRVRVLSRNIERAKDKLNGSFEFIEGDIRDIHSLIVATRDCHGVHINLNSTTFEELEQIEHKGTLNLIEAAKQNKLQKITLISGLGVKEKNTRFHFIRIKYKIENAVINSGIFYNIFACTHFMDTLPMYIKGDKAMILGNQPHRIHWVAASDYARMVARAYQLKETDNKKFYVMGPEALTLEEALTKYCAVNYPKINISKVPLAMLGFISSVSFNKQLKYIVHIMRYFSKTPEDISPDEIDTRLGKPATTLEQWLKSEN